MRRITHAMQSQSPGLSLCDRAERPDKPVDLLLAIVIMHRSTHPVAENAGLRIQPGKRGTDDRDVDISRTEALPDRLVSAGWFFRGPCAYLVHPGVQVYAAESSSWLTCNIAP